MKRTFWIGLFFTALVHAEKLAPLDRGAPAELGGEVRVEQRGAHLWLNAWMPEAAGKVLARSIGRNPVWEKDHDGSPPVEDRVVWRIRYRRAGGVPRELVIEGNPWGAYRTEEGGQLTPDLGLARSAQVTTEGWTFEATVPLKALDLDWNSAGIEWRVERIRSRRALAPEYRWQWPTGSGLTKLG